ncbi:hypothetical protein [Ornithinibacillus californiensis]|uniref:hypothetical protein n=1 Tax=Ornithinibacillus californiensis TaxID=161536 RepID=UPI00064DF2F6|nr:hypothetical protein [Ornithinibacillus californiensis]
MNNWRAAFQLTKWEIKNSAINLLLAYIATGVVAFIFIIEYVAYLEDGLVLYDLFFVIVFGAAPLFPKPKSFEAQHIQHRFLAAPVVVLQKHLPIKDIVIIYSRLIMHSLYTIPVQLSALVILYFATPLHNTLSIGSFLAFIIIWLSFSIYIGYFVPRFSIGLRGFWITNSGLGILILILLFVITFGLTLIHVIFDHGIVYWSIMAARDYPFLSIGLSIILATIGYIFWKRNMQKALKTVMFE